MQCTLTSNAVQEGGTQAKLPIDASDEIDKLGQLFAGCFTSQNNPLMHVKECAPQQIDFGIPKYAFQTNPALEISQSQREQYEI